MRLNEMFSRMRQRDVEDAVNNVRILSRLAKTANIDPIVAEERIDYFRNKVLDIVNMHKRGENVSRELKNFDKEITPVLQMFHKKQQK